MGLYIFLRAMLRIIFVVMAGLLCASYGHRKQPTNSEYRGAESLRNLTKLLAAMSPGDGWQIPNAAIERSSTTNKRVLTPVPVPPVPPVLSRRQSLQLLTLPVLLATSSADAFDSKISMEEQYDMNAESYSATNGGAAADFLGYSKLRAKALSSCKGRVLEVGCGTGLNLQYYDGSKVDRLDAVDLSRGMLRVAEAEEARLRSAGEGSGTKLPEKIKFQKMDATNIRFADNLFDTVVDTFSLCVYEDPELVLKEMARVCKPGGRIVLLAHKRSDLPVVGQYQDIMGPIDFWFGSVRAQYNQRVDELLGDLDLRIVSKEDAVYGTIGIYEVSPNKWD